MRGDLSPVEKTCPNGHVSVIDRRERRCPTCDARFPSKRPRKRHLIARILVYSDGTTETEKL